MKEKDSEKQAPENNLDDNRLEAVRDLLFGPNDQQYRQEFKDIKDQIAKNRADVDNNAESLKTDILDRLEKLEKKVAEDADALKSDIVKQIDQLNAGKVDRVQLAQLLQSIAKELEA